MLSGLHAGGGGWVCGRGAHDCDSGSPTISSQRSSEMTVFLMCLVLFHFLSFLVVLVVCVLYFCLARVCACAQLEGEQKQSKAKTKQVWEDHCAN